MDFLSAIVAMLKSRKVLLLHKGQVSCMVARSRVNDPVTVNATDKGRDL